MSLLFCDSFSHYSTDADVALKWNVYGNQSYGAMDVDAGRRGGGAFVTSAANYSANPYLSVTVTSGDTFFLGVACKREYDNNSSGQFYPFTLREGSTSHVGIGVNGRGQVYAFRDTPSNILGTSTSAPVRFSTWHYIESKFVIHDSSGEVTVKVDGAEVLALTSVDTRNGGTGVANTASLHYEGSSSHGYGAAVTYCDFYVCDDAGSAPANTFLGDVRVDKLKPSGAGATTNFTPLSGANYTNVDDDTTTDGDTTYVESSTVDHVDTYAFDNLTHTPVTIFGVQSVIMARKDDANARYIEPVVRHSGTDHKGTNHALASSYTFIMDMYEVNPGTSSAWDASGVNGAEFGFAVQA